jgi:hypothetical protein
VLEETGYDLEGLLNDDDVIELIISGKQHKLFIVAGVDPESAVFAPQCKGVRACQASCWTSRGDSSCMHPASCSPMRLRLRRRRRAAQGAARPAASAPPAAQEIGAYAWHRIAELPINKDEANQVFVAEDGTRHKFFMIWPFMKPLKKWIRKRRNNVPDWDMPAGDGATAAAAAAAAALAGGAHMVHMSHVVSLPPQRSPASGQHLLALLQQHKQQQQQQQHAATPPRERQGDAKPNSPFAQQQAQEQQQQQQQPLHPLTQLFANANKGARHASGAAGLAHAGTASSTGSGGVQQAHGGAQQRPAAAQQVPAAMRVGGAAAVSGPLSAFKFDVAAIMRAMAVP